MSPGFEVSCGRSVGASMHEYKDCRHRGLDMILSQDSRCCLDHSSVLLLHNTEAVTKRVTLLDHVSPHVRNPGGGLSIARTVQLRHHPPHQRSSGRQT